MRSLKRIRCAASLLFILGACATIMAAQEPAKTVNNAPAQEPAKAADAPPSQKSLEPFNFPDFTAIQKIGTSGKSLLMKVYFSGSTVRVDVSPTITNLFATPTSKVYRVVTYPNKASSCVVMGRNEEHFMASPLEMLLGVKVERTPAGTDIVDGHKCKVENVVVTRADGRVMKSKVWESDDFRGLPIKIISEVQPHPDKPAVKIGALYGDFKFEKVDPALLTPPERCTPIEKEYQVVERKVVK